ncbi:uncharacterized protein HPF18_0814 [Helicobacter pylori]|nr:uncharacterized protein HPF18_0814 [Helicobacter pylori]
MVAVVEIIIEFLGNNFLPFKAFGVMCWIESFKILPFSLMSSILNQGIVPFSQNSGLFFDGV